MPCKTPLPAIQVDGVLQDFVYEYISNPPPPKSLWDTKDADLLDLSRCRAFIRMVELDPKNGTFRLRMKCLWVFRTLNSKEEAEIHLRGVPGIRMPGLIVTVEESRIWKDLDLEGSAKTPTTTSKTLCWRGISLFTMDGFKAFNMLDFPFDRHILNLERIEFVWRTHKDEADYHKSMKLVELTLAVSSTLPEWQTPKAYIKTLNEVDRSADISDGTPTDSPPTYASKFTVHLRIQRKHEFYGWQVFLVAYLITLLSCTPLGMPPEATFLGDRLSMYSGGMLTLVAFKYGVSEHLPSVPYQTFTDWFLLFCILTVFACAIFTLYPYRITEDDERKEFLLDIVENIVGVVVFVVWTLVLLWATIWKPMNRLDWERVLAADQDEQDDFGKEEKIEFDKELESEGEFAACREATRFPTFRSNRGEECSPAAEPCGPAKEWDVMQVSAFVGGLKLAHCLGKFKENAVDGKMLLGLTQEEMVSDLGLTKLQAKKVRDHLKQHA